MKWCFVTEQLLPDGDFSCFPLPNGKIKKSLEETYMYALEFATIVIVNSNIHV